VNEPELDVRADPDSTDDDVLRNIADTVVDKWSGRGHISIGAIRSFFKRTARPDQASDTSDVPNPSFLKLPKMRRMVEISDGRLEWNVNKPLVLNIRRTRQQEPGHVRSHPISNVASLQNIENLIKIASNRYKPLLALLHLSKMAVGIKVERHQVLDLVKHLTPGYMDTINNRSGITALVNNGLMTVDGRGNWTITQRGVDRIHDMFEIHV
jgi:hypothetical protein